MARETTLVPITSFVNWIAFAVLLPLGAQFALWWPIGAYALDVSFLFERLYASGDLLPFSALLLLGLHVEVDQLRLHAGNRSVRLLILDRVAVISALLCLFVYGFVKSKYVAYAFPLEGKELESDITALAVLSVAVVIGAVAVGTAMRVTLLRELMERVVRTNQTLR